MGIYLKAEIEENCDGYKKNIRYKAYAVARVDESKLHFKTYSDIIQFYFIVIQIIIWSILFNTKYS